MTNKIVYQWAPVATLQKGWHIHIDSLSNGINADYVIVGIESVGEDVIEIRAIRGDRYGLPSAILHRKPTDEVSVFGVEEQA